MTKFITAILACYRLTTMIVYDEGPFKIIKKFRAWIGTHDNQFVRENGGSLVHCPYCMGIWVAALVMLLMRWKRVYPALLVLGIAGGQSLIMDFTIGRENGAD